MCKYPSWIIAGLIFAHTTQACGPWLPNRLLENGGQIILSAPEFYFTLEVSEIARDYPTPFAAGYFGSDDSNATTLADLADFAEAAKIGAVSADDASVHEGVRRYLNSAHPGEPEPTFRAAEDEFTLYDRGAVAFKQQKLAEAQAAWQSVLDLPKEKRQFRSTWAAYMLGKSVLSTDPTVARAMFQKTRELAATGCKDTLALASESLGWEARCELDAQQFERAAPLYMNQLASGDSTAIDSAKQLAGDNYPEEQWARFAADPLLRRITSAHVLARCTYDTSFGGESTATLQKWLTLIEKQEISSVSEADRLGWLAYTAGHYDDAARWLKRVPAPTSMSLWLKAKLDFRAGKLPEAEAALTEAIRGIPDDPDVGYVFDENIQVKPRSVGIGDLGMMQLARSEFTSALQTFLEGDHWQDAAYIAERILTVGELSALLEKNFPWTTEQDDAVKLGEFREKMEPSSAESAFQLRWLLARRLARSENFAEAQPFLPKELRPTLDSYATALKKGRSRNEQKAVRAESLWQAAQIARAKGMELFGSENEPDAFVWNGNYEQSEVAHERLAGKYRRVTFGPEANTESIVPLVLSASKSEKARLANSGISPNKRFHYRYQAANLAWEAAQLMPDQNEQTAVVLNRAGSWLKDRDDQAADRFLQAIERRCSQTETGRRVVEKHWFVAPAEAPTAT